MKEKIKSILTLLKEKRKIVITNPSSFEQKFAITLTRSSFLLISLVAILIFSFFIYLTISYTSLRNYIPGYPNINNIEEVYEIDNNNLTSISEIKKENENRDLWINNLKNILSNNDEILFANLSDTIKHDSVNYKNIIFERPLEDSILREKIKQEDLLIKKDKIKGALTSLNFLSPVRGKLIKKQSEVYKGIDLKTDINSSVKAAMQGVVIAKTKHSAIIQHPNNIISIYKNCLTLKLTEGEDVSRGKQIGVVTDSVFHFELWLDGKSIDPKDYIK